MMAARKKPVPAVSNDLDPVAALIRLDMADSRARELAPYGVPATDVFVSAAVPMAFVQPSSPVSQRGAEQWWEDRYRRNVIEGTQRDDHTSTPVEASPQEPEPEDDGYGGRRRVPRGAITV